MIINDDLRSAVRARLTRAAAPRDEFVPLAAYARRYVLLRGRPFSFVGHDYLRAIYDETHPRTVFMKAAQVGLSTHHVIKAAWLARLGGAKTLYLLPTEALARLFARDRVPALLAGEAGRDVTFVRWGAGLVLFRGVLNEAGVRAQDADFVILDELDAAAPRRTALAADRILHSPLAWLAHLSTPTLPGAGVAALYDASDQRRWLVRCPRCRWEGDLVERFPACVMGVRGRRRRCPACGRAFIPRGGRWVAAFPSRASPRGYHIHHLATTLAAEEILRQFEAALFPYEAQRFHNAVLGLPYIPAGAGIADDVLTRAASDYAPEATGAPTYAGVDVGDVSHALAAEDDGGVLRVTGLAQTATFEELAAFLARYNVVAAVIDAMPYKASVLELGRLFRGRLALAYFRDSGWGVGIEKYAGDYVTKLTLDRTAAFDRALSFLQQGRIRLPALRYPAVETLGRHLKALRRTTAERANGTVTARWLSAGADHYAAALVYLVAAWELWPPFAGEPPAVAVPRRFRSGGA